jgi:hypothetical protein
MITYSMNIEEIRKEVKGDMNWITGLANGMMLNKYRNEFSRYRPAGKTKVLEVSKYTTPTRKNKVWIVWVKEVIDNRSITLSFYTFFERTTKDGKLEWVLATPSSTIILTQHCFDRLLERAGLTFKQVLEAMSDPGCLSYVEPYFYKGKLTFASALGDYGLFLCEIEDDFIICKTFVSKQMLGEEQVEALKNSIEFGIEKEQRLAKESLDEHIAKKQRKKNYSNRCPKPV